MAYTTAERIFEEEEERERKEDLEFERRAKYGLKPRTVKNFTTEKKCYTCKYSLPTYPQLDCLKKCKTVNPNDSCTAWVKKKFIVD